MWSYSDQMCFHIYQSSCETPDRIVIPTKLTVESCVAWRAFTSPIAVHTDTPILAKAFLCRHRKRESVCVCVCMCVCVCVCVCVYGREAQSWKVCLSCLKASSYIMLSFKSKCKHRQKIQMVNMCTICWASFICYTVNYVLIRRHFSFSNLFQQSSQDQRITSQHAAHPLHTNC